MKTMIERAERLGRVRACLFYMMAAIFVLNAALNFGEPQTIDRLALWVVLAVLMAANLTPIVAWLRPSGVATLLNDETTRDHRQMSFAAGFWAAIIAAIALYGVAIAMPVPAPDVARIVVTAGLTAALVSFATLELRAAA